MSKAERIRQLPAALVAWWRALLSPPSNQTVCDWAYLAFDLSSESADRGPFTVRRRPYMREPIERHGDPKCRILTLCWGTQLGKTIVLYIGRFYRNRVLGYSCLIVLPSITYARRIAKTRILPMLRQSAVMREIIPPHRHSIQALEQYFTTCYNIITGSNSPANLAGQPLPDTLGDEPDKYDEGDEAETSAPNLIPQRSKTFDYSLNTWASSPSKPEGFIWGSLHAGDHRRFQVWCPKCGKHHPITKEQFRHPDDAKLKNGKWDYERIIEETWHECPHNCGYRFTESDKHRAYAQDWTASKNFPNRKKWFKNLADYEAEIERLGIDDFRKTYPVFWLPSNEEGGRGHNSYHLPSWYSPDGKCSFGELRCQYLRARSSGRIQDMQDVYNQTFAEAFDITTYGVSRITDLPKGAYELGDHWEEAQIHLTDGKPVRILALDRQQASFWGVCRTVGIDGSTRLFWEGELATFDECDLKAQELGAQTVLCDVSFKLKETLSECHKRGWIGMRGEPKKFYPEMLPATKEFPHGQTVRVIYRWANYRASCGNDVATLCWASQGGQDQLAALATHPEKIWTVCATPSNEYVKQMQSKHYDKNQWTKKDDKAPDHLWDCESEIAVWLEVCGIKNEVNAS